MDIEKATYCNGGRDGGPGRGEDPSAGVVVRHSPCFCFQGVFSLVVGECDHAYPYQRADPSLTWGDARFIGVRGLERHLACVFAGEIGDDPLSDRQKENQASCVFWGLFENI